APFQVFLCDFLTPYPNTASSADVGFPLHLPEGALIDEVDFNYWDTVVDGEPDFNLRQIGVGGSGQILSQVLPGWDQGAKTATFAVSPRHEVHNEGHSYALNFHADTVDGSQYQGLYNITIRYRLQVSPPPEEATFGDVPTDHPFFQFVEAL